MKYRLSGSSLKIPQPDTRIQPKAQDFPLHCDCLVLRCSFPLTLPQCLHSRSYANSLNWLRRDFIGIFRSRQLSKSSAGSSSSFQGSSSGARKTYLPKTLLYGCKIDVSQACHHGEIAAVLCHATFPIAAKHSLLEHPHHNMSTTLDRSFEMSEAFEVSFPLSCAFSCA